MASHLCHRRLVLPSWLVLLHLVAARCTPAAAQPRHDSGSLRWFPRRRWMAPPQPRWRPCMASASKIPCGHMKKGWSISDDSSHGATGNLMWCFHPLDIASSSAWSPFQ